MLGVGDHGLMPNKSLQGTFDSPPTFASAKTAVASNAPELRRSPALRAGGSQRNVRQFLVVVSRFGFQHRQLRGPRLNLASGTTTANAHRAFNGDEHMSAYAIFEIDVTDPDRYEEYKKLAPPAIAAYGGKYLTRGGKPEVLEGAWSPNRVVVLEFPTMEKAKEWLESPEYQEARALRHSTATTNAIVVPGV